MGAPHGMNVQATWTVGIDTGVRGGEQEQPIRFPAQLTPGAATGSPSDRATLYIRWSYVTSMVSAAPMA